MRKNSPRKWVHALLDLLPLLILPIFGLAVRSDNNFQPIEVQAQEYEVVDFNQLFEPKNDTESYNNVTITLSDYLLTANGTNNEGSSIQYFLLNSNNFRNNHKYILYGDSSSDYTGNGYYFNVSGLPVANNTIFTYGNGATLGNLYYRIYTGNSIDISFYVNLFDLTQMFGAGNEPTAQQFITWYTNDYYNYTLSHKELLNVGTTTLNDTDVGSQMVYTLYNATDKYFNMNSVFNLNSVWSWIQLNIFNGNTPLVAYVIWQVIIYEFIVDILFIFYSFFMFLIDFCEYLLEKPFNKINRGK